MNNVDIIKQGYKHFSEGNVEAVLAIFDPEIEWDECTGLPYISGDGIFHGPNEIVQNVFAPIPEHIDGFNVEIDDFIDGGNKVVMKGHYTGTWKATGKKFRANAAHIWTLHNGKATHFFQAVDIAEIINPD